MSPGVELGELQSAYDGLMGSALGKDAQQYAAQFVEDCVLMVPHSPALRGRAALTGWVEAFLTEWTIEIDTVAFEKVTVGDRVSFAWWNAAGTYVSTNGERVSFDQKYLDTLVRETEGDWRFAVHMVSSNVEDDGIWATWRPSAEAHAN